jgi:hypothetical protein
MIGRAPSTASGRPGRNVWISGARAGPLFEFTADGRFLKQIGEGGQCAGDPTALGGPPHGGRHRRQRDLRRGRLREPARHRLRSETGAYKRTGGIRKRPRMLSARTTPASPPASFRNPCTASRSRRTGCSRDRTNNRIRSSAPTGSS